MFFGTGFLKEYDVHAAVDVTLSIHEVMQDCVKIDNCDVGTTG